VRKPTAAIGTIGFFALAPGVVAFVLPGYLTDGWARHQPRYGWPGMVAGAALVAAGVQRLYTFARYVTDGLGTPAPAAPTERLVVGGLNRYVRNPMYVSVVITIVGQSLILAKPVLLAYAATVFAAHAAFTRWYEEPFLAHRFGAQYDAYRQRVPRWVPRLIRRR
jgi:protein-S-isoprenylcysteine O-methyltransferase Ste14